MKATTLYYILWLGILTHFPSTTNAFASWLKCYVDLDPDEVVMWQSIVPADQAKHKVVLQVGWEVPSNNNNNDGAPSPPQTMEWHSESPDIYLPPPPSNDKPWPLHVRLLLPPALQGQDVQFVVQVTVDVVDQAAEAVEFVGPTRMCDGTRASSRSEAVVLEWDHALASTLRPFHLVAGWAAGMEAVTLTPVVTLHPKEAAHDEL